MRWAWGNQGDIFAEEGFLCWHLEDESDFEIQESGG